MWCSFDLVHSHFIRMLLNWAKCLKEIGISSVHANVKISIYWFKCNNINLLTVFLVVEDSLTHWEYEPTWENFMWLTILVKMLKKVFSDRFFRKSRNLLILFSSTPCYSTGFELIEKFPNHEKNTTSVTEESHTAVISRY